MKPRPLAVVPAALIVLLALGSGCAAVSQVYRAPGYDPLRGEAAVKRVAILGWAPADRAGLAALLAEEAKDLIKLRKNYLVCAAGAAVRDWTEGCGEHREGVIMLRALAADPPAAPASERAVTMHLAAELYRCADGALLWRACAGGAHTAGDASLAQLTASYAQAVGPQARGYAAPAFVLLQGLVAALPDPALADADIEEKLDLE